MELDNIMEEVKNPNFCEATEDNTVAYKDADYEAVEKDGEDAKKKNFKKFYLIKLIKLFVIILAVGVCSYYELIQPVLYIPIEIICLCAVCFRFGEWKAHITNI